MVDTLRSIHFHTPSTVDPTWSPQLCEGQYDLKALSDGLILNGTALPSGLLFNDYLLILLDLLSTINTLLNSLGPLTSNISSIRRVAANKVTGATTSRGTSTLPTSMPSNGQFTTWQRVPTNPWTPFTADRDYNDLRSNINSALVLWETSFRASGHLIRTGVNTHSDALFTLFYFAKLLLEAGPAVSVIPSLVGYTSEPHESLPPTVSRPCAPHTIGVQLSDKAVQYAVEILKSAERRQRLDVPAGAYNQPAEPSPMWYPITLFYGALVIWSRRRADEEKKVNMHILMASERLLQSFHTALKTLEHSWDCANHMAWIIKRLMN